jgi:hypothetical protein
MAQLRHKPPHDPAVRTRRSDPRSTRGQEHAPRKPRRGPAWALLAVSLTMLAMGLVLPQGLVLAAGLVTSGVAAHLLTSPREHRPRS